MSIIEAATKAMLLKKIQEAEWKMEEVPITKKTYCLADCTPFVGFHASGGNDRGEYWVIASFSDKAVSVNDEERLLEKTFVSEHWENCLSQAREWLLANVDKAVEIWAKKYNPSQQKTAKGNQ